MKNLQQNMAKMTKTQTIAALCETTGLAKKDVTYLLVKLVELAHQQTKKEGEFVINGIGKLVKVKRAARKGVNPSTGEKINIPAKTVVKFRVAKAAKDAVL